VLDLREIGKCELDPPPLPWGEGEKQAVLDLREKGKCELDLSPLPWGEG